MPSTIHKQDPPWRSPFWPIRKGRLNSPHTAISWSSKQQPTMALSSTEAEYMALTQACKEAIRVKRFLTELSTTPTPYNWEASITIFADNQGSMALAKNPEFHGRMKHIGIQHHFIREQVTSQQVTLEYLPTGDMLADLLTKPLARNSKKTFFTGGIEPASGRSQSALCLPSFRIS